MKKMLKTSLVGFLAIATLVVPTASAFAADTTDVPVKDTVFRGKCKYKRVPIYSDFCHGYQLIIGYEEVCTVHNH